MAAPKQSRRSLPRLVRYSALVLLGRSPGMQLRQRGLLRPCGSVKRAWRLLLVGDLVELETGERVVGRCWLRGRDGAEGEQAARLILLHQRPSLTIGNVAPVAAREPRERMSTAGPMRNPRSQAVGLVESTISLRSPDTPGRHSER